MEEKDIKKLKLYSILSNENRFDFDPKLIEVIDDEVKNMIDVPIFNIEKEIKTKLKQEIARIKNEDVIKLKISFMINLSTFKKIKKIKQNLNIKSNAKLIEYIIKNFDDIISHKS